MRWDPKEEKVIETGAGKKGRPQTTRTFNWHLRDLDRVHFRVVADRHKLKRDHPLRIRFNIVKCSDECAIRPLRFLGDIEITQHRSTVGKNIEYPVAIRRIECGAVGDLNNDGAVDVVVCVNGSAPVVLKKNAQQGTTGWAFTWKARPVTATLWVQGLLGLPVVQSDQG